MGKPVGLPVALPLLLVERPDKSMGSVEFLLACMVLYSFMVDCAEQYNQLDEMSGMPRDQSLWTELQTT